MRDIERIVEAAEGYSELGMAPEALAELASLPEEVLERESVLQLRLTVLMRARRWTDGLSVCRRLCEVAPQSSAGFIHAAYCLHELEETEMAKALLLAGPASLIDQATYHYNLACYECVLGNREAAMACLEACFNLDKKYRSYAREDADLAPLFPRPA